MQVYHGQDDEVSFWGPAKVGRAHSVMQDQREAWVLIFRPGREDEGVYTLQGAPREPSSPTSFVLAFERTDDANQFAQQLHAQGFDVATPLPWSKDELVYFCEGANYEVSLVPSGAQISPPPKHGPPNDMFNHNRDFEPRFGDNRRPDPRFGDPRFGPDGPTFGPGGGPTFGPPGRFGGDPRFGGPGFGGPGFGDPRAGPMPGGFSDPARNYPGMDDTRPDAYAMERSRLEALLPVEPEDCLLDGADDDCLHDDENSN